MTSIHDDAKAVMNNKYFITATDRTGDIKVWIPEDGEIEEHEHCGFRFIVHHPLLRNTDLWQVTEPQTGTSINRDVYETKSKAVHGAKSVIDAEGVSILLEGVERGVKALSDVEKIMLKEYIRRRAI